MEYFKMSSQYQDKLQETRRQVDKREFLILLQFVLMLVLAVVAFYGFKTVKVKIDPGLDASKTYVRGQVDDAYVYSFTDGLLQALYTWKDDGQEDYERNIETLKGFITPGCYESLKKDQKFRLTHGELRNRVRLMIPVQFAEGAEQVRFDPPGKWLVRLQYDMQETIKGVPIKDGRYYWDVPVIKDSSRKHLNRFELSVDCPFINNTPVLVQEYKK